MGIDLKNNIAITNNALNEGSTSYHLHFLRGVAAVLVLVNHYRNFFFVSYSELENPSVFTMLLYSIAGLGHQAVMVFFVLSGFFITKSILTNISRNTWSWKNYLTSRLTRLYVVLIPVLLLVFIFDLIGSVLFDYSYFVDDINARLDPLVFLGNLAFLQDILVPKFGTNAPLWSLAYEFWYYMLFPCLLLFFINKKSFAHSLFYLTVSGAIVYLVGKEILLYFIVWLLGALVYVLPKLVVKSNIVKLLSNGLALFTLAAALGLSRLDIVQSQFVGDLLIAGAFSFLVYSILHFKVKFNYLPRLKSHYYTFSETLANFSYTLYLIHYPILVFIFAFILDAGGGAVQPTTINIIYGVIACGLLTLLAYLLSLITEAKTSSVRNFVFRMFKDKQPEKYKRAQ